MSAISTIAPKNTALTTAEQNEAIRTALKSSLYPGASDASVDMVLAYCRAGGYDPMTKPVHIVPMTVSTGRKDERGYDIKEKRDVVMPGIGLYRTNAARTNQYAGCSEPEFGPSQSMKFKREKWEDGVGGKRVKKFVEAEMFFPEWCRVTVKKLIGAATVEFTAKEYWLENYANKGDSDAPNAMWEKRPFGQLAKCAEAQALRKAFPEAVGSQPTAEEIEGKAIDSDVIDVASTRVQMPQAKQVAHEVTEVATEQPGAEAQPVQDSGLFVTESQKKLLMRKAANAGMIDEGELLARFSRVDSTNINSVLAQLQQLAEQQES